MEIAAKLAMSGKIKAICTAPLNKEVLDAGGHTDTGEDVNVPSLLTISTGQDRGSEYVFVEQCDGTSPIE
jgi:hypothetical protein